MSKSLSILMFLLVSILNGCSKNEYKTNIKVRLLEEEYLYSISSNNTDSAFNKTFLYVKSNYNPTKEKFITAFTNQLLKQNPDCILASYYISFELKDKISLSSSNQEVVDVLNEEVKLAKEKTIQVLIKRIESAFKPASVIDNLFNHTNVEANELPETGIYSFTINKKTDPKSLGKLLQSRIELGFWETFDNTEIFKFLLSANIKLKEILSKRQKEKKMLENENSNSITSNKEMIEFEKDNPLFKLIRPSVSADGKLLSGCIIGTSYVKDTALINEYLAMPEIGGILPRNLKLVWEARPLKANKEYIQLYAIKITSRDGNPAITGDDITWAITEKSNSIDEISLKMTEQGTYTCARLTRENIGKQIAIIINGTVYSAPIVNSEIKDGKLTITGSFTESEANYLVTMLNAGNLPKIIVEVVEEN